MDDLFSIGDAARMANLTAETLRHYDRIGLVKPAHTDEWTGYRYYTHADVIRLSTIQALRLMGLSLKEIGQVLTYDDLDKIVAFLVQAEARADEKIAELARAKARIRAARTSYETKRGAEAAHAGAFVRCLPRRVILLSLSGAQPSLQTLHNYLSPFYAQLGSDLRSQFEFEDCAGLYTAGGVSRLFAVCRQYTEVQGLQILPEGRYLCADCTEETRECVLAELIKAAETQYARTPAFTVSQIRVSGILQWQYQIQVPLDA